MNTVAVADSAFAGLEAMEVGQFRFLASFLAGRTVEIAAARADEPAYTDGNSIFVSSGRSADWCRREVVVQAALIGAGSLNPESVRRLRGRTGLARRYLTLEGQRVLSELSDRVPLAVDLVQAGIPTTTGVAQSVEYAGGRRALPDPPVWFGTLRPSLLMSAARHRPTGAEAAEGQANVPPNTSTDSEDDEGSVASRRTSDRTPSIKKEHSLASLLVKKLSTRKAKGDTSGAGSGQVSLQRVSALDPDARPVPVPVRFTDEGLPPRLAGASGALYPEWDAGSGRYRPEWCLVSDFTIEPLAGAAEIRVSRDEELRRRLSTLGLGPTRCRRRPDGDDLDVDALVDVATGLRAGYSAGEAVYIERRQIARDLGVLILLDASGSAAEIDPDGRSVHELQRQTAATLAVTLEELGDRVAVYGFRSHGRSAVHLVSIKRFSERFGAAARANLKQLESAGYTRLGAAVRHAGELLKADAGTPFRLLLVLSDGFPFDAGYREAYAEADVRKALEELRRDGVACLCLSIGASTSTDVLARVFGTASHAHAATLQALSPHMDELFVGALRELAVSS